MKQWLISLQKSFGGLISELVRIYRFAWKDFTKSTILLVVLTLLASIFSYTNRAFLGLLLNKLTDIIAKKPDVGFSLTLLLGVLLASLIIPRLANAYSQFINIEFSRLFQHFYETAGHKKTVSLDFASQDDPKRKDLFQKVRDNMWRLTSFYLRPIWFLDPLFMVLATLVTLVTVNPWFGIILVVATVPELIMEVKTGYRMWGIWSANAEIKRKYYTYTNFFNKKESITELKLFSNIQYFLDKVRELFMDFSDKQSALERKRLWLSMGSSILAQGGVVLVSILMIDMAMRGDLKIGTFTFLFFLIIGFQQSLSQLFRFIGQQSEDSHHVRDYFDFLELKNTIEENTTGIKLPSVSPTIVFENVSFRYPDTENNVLNNVNLTITPGEKIAIVGVNGAGKSTLIKLLFRFYDPTEGRILVNGVDLREINQEDWYAHLGPLFQEYVNYRLTLREAIAVGDTRSVIADDRVNTALEHGEATGFISSWKDGLDQQLGKEFTGGVEPSVGQWQKLALSRVFYRNANIYVLDEPTSAIDAEAEANVFENLAKLPEDKTVIFVSHRFSTIRQANRICVIEDGAISELGTHEELIANKATYKRLFELQAKGYQ